MPWEGATAFTCYALGLHRPVACNLASVAGTGLGTVFRYWSDKWVFIAPPAEPERCPDTVPVDA